MRVRYKLTRNSFYIFSQDGFEQRFEGSSVRVNEVMKDIVFPLRKLTPTYKSKMPKTTNKPTLNSFETFIQLIFC